MKYQHLAIACTAANVLLWAVGSPWLARESSPSGASGQSSSASSTSAERSAPSAIAAGAPFLLGQTNSHFDQANAAATKRTHRALPGLEATPRPQLTPQSSFAAEQAALSTPPLLAATPAREPVTNTESSSGRVDWQNPLWSRYTPSAESRQAAFRVANLPALPPLAKVPVNPDLPISSKQADAWNRLVKDFDQNAAQAVAPAPSERAERQPMPGRSASLPMPVDRSPQTAAENARQARQLADDLFRAKFGTQAYVMQSIQASRLRQRN